MRSKVMLIFLFSIWLCCPRGSFSSNPPSSIHRILFLGNSITVHGPNPAIGWSGNWGMAASEANKDYVHQLVSRLGNVEHTEVNMGTFETNFMSYNLNSIDGYLLLRPDVIILQIGDNATDANGFVQYYNILVNHLSAKGRPLILCTSTWWENPIINEGVKSICSKTDRRFVDIGKLRTDPANLAGSERTFTNAGVASHPGDRGMAAIAYALYRAIR